VWDLLHDEMDDALLEVICEWLFIEEDVGVTEALVETVFHLFDALHDALDIPIARQHDDGRVGSTIQRKRWLDRPVIPIWDCTLRLVRIFMITEEAVDRGGIAICFGRHGEDEMECKLERGFKNCTRLVRLRNIPRRRGPRPSTSRV
jgi:hypothetical protein